MGLRTVAGIAACIMGVAVSIQSEAQTSRDGTAVHGCYFDSHEHLSLQDYDSIIVAYPKCAKAFFGRGNKYMLDSRYDEALKDYSEAIRLDPLYTDAFYNRALVYGIEKKFSLAFPDLDEVLRKNPNDAAALSWRMVDRMALGDQAKGDADASRLSAMNPKCPAVQLPICRERLHAVRSS